MAKFRKRPIIILAEQFHSELKKLPFSGRGDPVSSGCSCGENGQCSLCGQFYVRTPEGPMIVTDGDWIICGVNGEFYPCKPDIFAATYDPVA